MVDFKKGVVIVAITILFTVLVFSITYAIQEGTKYDDVCYRGAPYLAKPPLTDNSCQGIVVSDQEQRTCNEQGGFIDSKQDSAGCVSSFFCNTCNATYDKIKQSYDLYVFLFSGILGLVAIIGGLFLPRKNELSETISTGFMFGGLLTLLVGTLIYFDDASIIIRPIIILVELGIILLVAYKNFKK